MSDPVLCDYPYESNPWFPAETGTLYNSMIYPVMPYGIAGCIWYQGEANQGRASSYARVMQRLIGSWRTGFNKEFPFYLVQIAPFQYHSKDNGPALLREQQAMLPEMLDKVKMITVSDLVDNVQDIHPRDKRSVGKRLANLALDDTYHIYAGPYKSPVFESACRKGNHVTISFKDIKNGLGRTREKDRGADDGRSRPGMARGPGQDRRGKADCPGKRNRKPGFHSLLLQ